MDVVYVCGDGDVSVSGFGERLVVIGFLVSKGVR